jgi:hypothetical protein
MGVACSPTLREEYRWRVLDNRVQRMENEELHNLHSPPTIISIKSRRMRWARHVEIKRRREMFVGCW